MFTVKKLKISGFKSFAHSTEILIEDGVTGIIGPNGCGKSNVFEAIRWVMGESSSKSLRSSSQDEIIFNGTQSVPAKNFAEVSLELNDFEGNIPNLKTNDEKKVVISRILERGVGSFFKINDKDTLLLAIEKGSLRKALTESIYSVVGQESIDKNSKLFNLLMRARDEAHRFANKANRTAKRKSMQFSILDSIQGIGPKTKERLFNEFKSIDVILNTEIDLLENIKGVNHRIACEIKQIKLS